MKRQKDSEREAKEYGEKVKLSHSPGFRFEIIGDLARPFFFLAGSFRVSLDGLSERGSTLVYRRHYCKITPLKIIISFVVVVVV